MNECWGEVPFKVVWQDFEFACPIDQALNERLKFFWGKSRLPGRLLPVPPLDFSEAVMSVISNRHGKLDLFRFYLSFRQGGENRDHIVDWSKSESGWGEGDTEIFGVTVNRPQQKKDKLGPHELLPIPIAPV